MSRFARQIILREVGAAGQAAIERASLFVSEGLDPFVASVARAYGEGAGLRATAIGSPSPSLAWFPRLHHEAPRAVAHGALLALDSIHRALEAGPSVPQGQPEHDR